MVMDNITLGQIAIAVAFLVALVTGVKHLLAEAKGWISESMKTQMDEISGKIEAMERRIADVDMQTCKNYLVVRIAEIENGKVPQEVEKERFYEQYEHYIKIGGNSYIRKKVEQLEAEGKL